MAMEREEMQRVAISAAPIAIPIIVAASALNRLFGDPFPAWRQFDRAADRETTRNKFRCAQEGSGSCLGDNDWKSRGLEY
jgi:hypothetical protein